MINARPTLVHLGISTSSPVAAVVDVHNIVEEASQPLDAAIKVIEQMTGLRSNITNAMMALSVAQYVAKTAVLHEMFDPQETIDAGIAHHNAILDRHPYLRVTAELTNATETLANIEGADAKVVIKSDGKIKKGGKQIIAAELYQTYVTDATEPLDNKQFVQLLVDRLGMSKSGATTYAWNCRKQAEAA